jgi:dihydroflavonol-4-reductase
MRIVVTGGTGFVGSHCVRSLLAGGHEVVLLARDEARVPAALRPLGISPERYEVVLGDVLETDGLDRALAGADAVLHAANVYSLNARDAESMHRVNVDGTRAVLTAAAERGLDPIVHVSSCVALLPSDRLTATSPVGDPYGPYARSKAQAERVAMELRDAGAPIVITNPGSIYGPHQPHMGESAKLVRDILRGTARLSMRGGLGIVDVRDVAVAHSRLFVGGRPRRYLMEGRWLAFHDLFRHLERVVGHRLPRVRLPGRAAFLAGRVADTAQRRGVDPGFSSEPVWILLNWPPTGDEDARRELGIEWRPMTHTLRDTVAWLHERGHVSRRQAGNAAGRDWTTADPATPEPV